MLHAQLFEFLNMVKDTQASRLYPTISQSGTTKWVTRDIAALDFLLGIKMAKQVEIVRAGYERIQAEPTLATGKWWERLVQDPLLVHASEKPEVLLEAPAPTRGGGRRLEGDSAAKLQIPPTSKNKSTRQRYIARQAEIREWERHVAQEQDILGGRLFFSAKDNYPVSVFSVIKYEPKREEAARRRKKLEARGGGGTQFIVPQRDWRGTSYRALLPRVERKHQAFDRFLVGSHELPEDGAELKADDSIGNSSFSSETSSDEEDTYLPGFLDDPEMRQGRNRHVMIGDRVSGCIVSSTIQFVKPADLKADLNKQFRERFDGWEPPKAQHKYIGAKPIDGVYTLIDPTEESEDEENIRMPPSLTLSKIRSLKRQAIHAAVDAQLEMSTLALSFVYFERLCLDCRVDKSNRRLAFAACMLLAAKINEAHVNLIMQPIKDDNMNMHSMIRPSQSTSGIFAALLEFFTHDWALSLKHLFSAEWGVFAALGFRLHASPSQVEFHFRRILKVLGWNGVAYIGPEMYEQWQDVVEAEVRRTQERESKREIRRKNKERKLLKLELQLQKEEKEWEEEEAAAENENENENENEKEEIRNSSRRSRQKTTAMKLLKSFTNLARPHPAERFPIHDRLVLTSHEAPRRRTIIRSPSMPFMTNGQSSPNASNDARQPPNTNFSQDHIVIDIPTGAHSRDSSVGMLTDDEVGGIIL